MNNKKNIILVFIVVSLFQLFVPAKMIIERENVIDNGKEYKFKTEPVDPLDIFRGKYITINFSERTIDVPATDEWERDETIYVTLLEDSLGFAKIGPVSKEEPAGGDFIKTKVERINISWNRFSHEYDSTIKKIRLEYPFFNSRFYMEESKAYEAEKIYRMRFQNNDDSGQTTYAQVYIKDGMVVINDVMINDSSISDIVKTRLNTFVQ